LLYAIAFLRKNKTHINLSVFAALREYKICWLLQENKTHASFCTLASLRETLRPLRLIAITLLLTLQIHAQETHSWAQENIQFSGYVKYLNTSTFNDLDAILNDNLLHNRLNLKVYLNTNFSTTLEIRNRVFWGNSIQLIPDYASAIDVSSQDIDLSVNLLDKPALLLHSKIDRLYVDYQSDKWHITLGRQRINWGKNLAWNPNDLFNAYSFFDFDYEERPGVDALRIQYNTSGNSSIETAINYSDNWEYNTLAIKYNFHKFKYDFQLLAAKYLQDYTLGMGWEGAIKNVGIKGEMSYFIPQEKSISNADVLVGAFTLDYYFKNGISTNIGTLYNSAGIQESDLAELNNFTNFQQSAKNLMPNQWSFFGQLSKSLTPAIGTSFSTIYAYELHGVYLMPQMSYSMAQNWDFDVIAQVFYGKQDQNFENIANSVFLRFRWSF